MKRIAVALMLLCASCAHHTVSIATTSTPTSSPSPSRSPSPVSTTRIPTPTPAPVVRTSAPSGGIVLPGAGSSTQAIVVRTSSWNATSGTLTAYEKERGVWKVFVPSTTAWVGYNGFAQDKREGDGRTPAGVYGFSFAFGTGSDPGTKLSYRHAGPDDVWVDDPSSSLYNTWQRGPSNGRWRSAEPLDQPAPYAHAAVVAYNTARVPGKGSAIFMHVSLGHPTSGCVSVDSSVLVTLLRWLDPAQRPVIVMGPSSYVNSL